MVMCIRQRAATLVCCLLFASHVHADAPLVYDISLEAPLAQRTMLEKHLDLYRWRGNERMDEQQLRRLVDQAPAQIRAFLASEGYYAPRVSATLTQSGADWHVQLTLEPGEPARVGPLDLRVTGTFAESGQAARLDTLRAAWPMRPGAIFRHADWESAKRASLRGLLLDGYPAAHIQSSQATVDPEKNTVQLALTLDSGPTFSFGAPIISGLRRYPASVVERLNPIQPGETYSQAKLLEFQSRLQDSPYFAGASVHVETDPAHPTGVPIEIEVEENRARTLGLGLGISTDTGARAQLDYRDLNLLDRALRLSSRLKLAEKEQSLGGELQFPRTASGFQDSLSADLTRADIEGEITRTLTLGAKRSRPQDRNEITQALRYYHERQEVAGAAGNRSTSLVASWSWTRRDLDSLLYPGEGVVLNLQADAAHQALLSDRTFARGYGKATWFQRIGNQGQAILRGELGVVAAESRDGIPADFLFRAGGDQTVRGYAYQSLGVRDGDAIVGGRWLAVTSAEYVHWLMPQWGAALFVDAGDAADHLGDLRPVLGYGLGARWKSPVGLLGLDLARGQETGQTRLHFAVGFSF
jgi:translocation and assembly module TamA